MVVDVKVPSVGESVSEGMIHAWKVNSGDVVKRDQVLLELETDKATVEIFAEQAGSIELLKKVGETVAVGEVIARINTDVKSAATPTPPKSTETKSAETSAPAIAQSSTPSSSKLTNQNSSDMPLSPSVRRMTEEHQVDVSKIAGTGKSGRITKDDVVNFMDRGGAKEPPNTPSQPIQKLIQPGQRTERREPMSMIRRRTAERLLHAQSNAAILTTFNEVDMGAVMDLRAKYKDAFKEKFGVSLGFMSFFVKASIEALKAFPAINGWIEGNEIVYHDYFDIGVAVSSDRGLMVPVVRNADLLSVSDLEIAIANFGKKAREGKISIDELTGGTFTISNGGVFGSLMSTPILNPPQSGILGMHKIQDRPVVVKGQVVIRPMMYLALSYDHRIVDGREAVQFLVKIKDCIEDPSRILVGV